jgi:hypothetical protein
VPWVPLREILSTLVRLVPRVAQVRCVHLVPSLALHSLCGSGKEVRRALPQWHLAGRAQALLCVPCAVCFASTRQLFDAGRFDSGPIPAGSWRALGKTNPAPPLLPLFPASIHLSPPLAAYRICAERHRAGAESINASASQQAAYEAALQVGSYPRTRQWRTMRSNGRMALHCSA